MPKKREFLRIKTPELLEALVKASADYCLATEMYFGKRYSTRNLIDLWRIHPTRFIAEAFEIKVSRADFRKDIRNSRKHKEALANCHRFFYLAPKGMLDADEIPDWAGLMEYDGNRFTTAKPSPEQPGYVLDHQLLINIFRRSSHFSRDNRSLHQTLRETSTHARRLVKENEHLQKRYWEQEKKISELENQLQELRK